MVSLCYAEKGEINMNELSIQYCFHCRRHAEGHINAHTHNGCELVYYASGSGRVFWGEEAYPFSAGTICLTHPDTPHSETWQEDGDVWCLVFDMPQEKRLPEGTFTDRDGDIFPLLEAFFREQQTNRDGAEHISIGYLSVILLLMARTSPRRRSLTPSRGDRLDNAYRYIQDHYMTEIAFDELALSVGYSYDRFRHLFKTRYHVSPKQMVLTKRLALAKQMLRDSDEKIETVALTCGFSSASQFNVIFKKYRGITPKEYRTMNKQKEQA